MLAGSHMTVQPVVSASDEATGADQDRLAAAYGDNRTKVRNDRNPRCRECKKMFAVFLTRPWQVICPRCKTVNQQGAVPEA